MLRVAVIGVGWAGARHVEAIRELNGNVAVECLVDNDAAFLAQRAAELGIEKTYGDYREALADPDVDAVDICLPHALHCPVALEAASARKHILCEKPLAMTVAEASRMIEAADANGVRLYVAENEAYTPYAHFLREALRTGEYTGDLTFGSLVSGGRFPSFEYPGRRSWLGDPERGGTGTWMLHGVHSMALLRRVFGEVRTVYVQEHHSVSFPRSGIEGTMSGLLTLESGVHVSVVQTCETSLPGTLWGITLYGEKGTLRAARKTCEVFGAERDASQPAIVPYPTHPLSDYAQEMAAFADYVAGISEGPTTGRSERRSLAIVEAGYESARTGRPVDLKAHFGTL